MMITSQASERLVWCDFIGGESEGSLRLVRFFFFSMRGAQIPQSRMALPTFDMNVRQLHCFLLLCSSWHLARASWPL